MNGEMFAKGLEKCRMLIRLLGQNIENLDDYGCPKIPVLSKWTVRVSVLVTFFDTKQGFTVPRGNQWCKVKGLCNICNFLYVFIVFVFTTNSILSTRRDFFL